MSTDSGSSSGSLSGSSEGEEDQQLVQQVVTGANADPQVLQYFWDLASLQQEERQAAATALVAALVNSQKAYDATHRAKSAQPAGNFEQEAGNRQQRMEECLSCCSPLMGYGLKRLARGLASSRQGARQGFAAALAATLAHSAAAVTGAAQQQQLAVQRPFVSAAGVLALLDACLEVTGSMKGTDQRDTLLGRVFGLAGLTRSGLITALPAAADGPSTSSCSSAVLSATAAVAEQLAGLLQRKSFLRESAAAGLVELLQDLDQQQMASVLQQAPKTGAILQASSSAASPESLYLALRLWHVLPAQQLQRCELLPKLQEGQVPPPRVFWEQPSAVKRKAVAAAAAAVLSAEQVQVMTPALLLSTASSPRLHPVWGCLLALLVPGFVPVKGQEQAEQTQKHKQQRSSPDPQQLQALWRHFVEGACLSSSHERKALALQLLQLLLPVMGPDMVPVVLCKPLLGCVATALKDKDSYLHASAKRCLDRLSNAADHSQVVQDDPAAAARLRLALAAALQSANLAAPGSKAGKAAKLGPLQGLDAAGVSDYVQQTLQGLVKAAQSTQPQANGAAGDEGESEEEEAVAADEGKALQQLEQLVAGLKLPAADIATLRTGLSFLAALSWLTVPPGFVAAAAGSSKKAGKKKHKQAAAAGADGADGVLQDEHVQEGLQLAASIQPQPSAVLRRTAAARLVGVLHSLHSRATALAAAAAHQKQPKQQDGKQQQKAAVAGADAAAAAGARAAAAQAAETLTVELLGLFAAVQKLPSVAVTADEDIAEMVEQLGQLSATIEQHVPSAPAAAANSSQQHQQATAAARKRVVLHLIHQLQLQLLCGGLSAEAAGSVVDDLEVSVLRGLGLNGQLLETLRAADSQAKLKLAGAAAEPSASEAAAASSEDGSEGSDSGSDDDDDDGSAWQDVLLDLLLSLLSNSSSEGGGGRGGSVSVPSVPLREACEAVFKAFAEDMTAQGISDLLRVLSQRASEVLKEAEEDEEEEVEQSEGGDDSSSSEDDSSDLDEEQQEQLKDLHKKTAADSSSESESEDTPKPSTAAANGTHKTPAESPAAVAAASSDDEGSESDEGMDDEAMMRMDAQLGAAVRASLTRSGGSAKDRAAALLALQLRVAALLEDWIKKSSRSPILLSVVLPLLKALVSARGPGGNPVLADRLAGLITKHLARARPAFPPQQADTAAAAAAGSSAQSAVTALMADSRKVLYYASRDKDPRVCAAAAQSLLVLISAGSEAGGAAAAVAQATAGAALQDFLTHKKSKLQQKWCEQLLARCFDAVSGGEGAGLQALLQACSKGRNESIKAKAVQLLPSLVTNKQPQQVAGLLAVLQQHQGLLAAALAAGVVGPYKGKDQHAAAVKAVVGVLAGVAKQGGGKRLAELVGSETVRELGKSVIVVKAAGVPPKVDGQLSRLVDTAGLQQLVASGKPDPARLALLTKARAALEGGPGKAAAAAAAAPANGTAAKGGGQGGAKQQGGKSKGKQQQENGQQKRKAEAAAEDQQPADGKHKKHKKQGQKQQQQEGEQQRHKKQGQKQAAAPAEDQGVAAAAAQAAAAVGGKGSSKRKHTAEGGESGKEVQQKKKEKKEHSKKHGKQQ